MSRVSNLDAWKQNLTGTGFKNLIWLRDKNGPLVLPVSILAATISVSKSPLVLSTLELLFDNFWIETHFFKEAVNHILPAVSLAVVTITMTMTVTVVLPLVLMSLRLIWLCLFVKDSHHYSWCSTGLLYLEEGMIVIKFFFAVRTIVKVFTNSALVANSNNWRLTATITRDTNVSNNLLRYWLLRFLSFRNLETDAFIFQKLVENDARLFFKLLLHQSLQSLSGKTFFLWFLCFYGTFSFFLIRLALDFNFDFFNQRLSNLLVNDRLTEDNWLFHNELWRLLNNLGFFRCFHLDR